jgi:hypothetical protein
MTNYISLGKCSQASSLRLAAHAHRQPQGHGMSAAAAPLEQGKEKGAVPEDG